MARSRSSSKATLTHKELMMQWRAVSHHIFKITLGKFVTWRVFLSGYKFRNQFVGLGNTIQIGSGPALMVLSPLFTALENEAFLQTLIGQLVGCAEIIPK